MSDRSGKTGLFERLLSLILVASAVVVAVALLKREFGSTNGGPTRQAREARYVSDWEQLATAGKAMGAPRSRIKLVVFTDFECPFCRRFNTTAAMIRAKYPSDVSYVFVHFPLSNHRFARPAARAAECGERFGGRFSQIADVLFENQDSLGLKSWVDLAVQAGIRDTVAFAGCIRDTSRLEVVEAGLAAGKKAGVSGTPAVMLNGWYYGGPPSVEELTRAIDDLLAGRKAYSGLPALTRAN